MASREFLISFGIFLIIASPFVNSQYFDPNLDDKTYLDMIESDVNGEVEEAKQELIGQAHLIEDVTKTFIGAKLKENLFRALRFLAENEVEQMAILEKQKTSAKQQKQLSKDDEDEDDATTVGATGTSAPPTVPSGLIPRVANIIKTIFGSDRVNLTSYVQSATKFLPESVGNQVIGVVKLLVQSPRTKPTTLIPTSIIYLTEEAKETTTQKTNFNSSKVSSGTSKPGNRTEDGEEEEEEEEDNSRQLRLPDLSGGLSILGAFLGGTSENRATSRRPAQAAGEKQSSTTESASGFEEETTSNTASLANFANDVRNGFGDLIKVVPDLFKGAREGVSLLTALAGLFGSFGGGGR